MSIKIMAYKCGMSRSFTKEGLSIPVTIIKIFSNYITGIRKLNEEKKLIKISACEIKKNTNKPLSGIFKKLKIPNLKYTSEYKININENYSIGEKIKISIFNISEKINITGITKGKGFSGVIKRHNFKSQRASHGNSLSHRAPGSIGQCQTPGRVFKGKKMPGRLGNKLITTKNLEIINIYENLDIMIIKGSVPGSIGSKILLKKI